MASVRVGSRMASCQALGQGAGEIALAGGGGAGDEDVVVASHPLVLGKGEDLGVVQAPVGAQVQILHRG